MTTTKKLLKRNFLWIVYIGFTIVAFWTKQDESAFISLSQYGYGKYILWLILFGFLAYSFYCGKKENFFKSVKRVNEMYWGRQIGIDLYIGLLLPLLIIYLHGGSFIFLLWLVPVILYANLATLLYFALNYDSLLAYFSI